MRIRGVPGIYASPTAPLSLCSFILLFITKLESKSANLKNDTVTVTVAYQRSIGTEVLGLDQRKIAPPDNTVAFSIGDLLKPGLSLIGIISPYDIDLGHLIPPTIRRDYFCDYGIEAALANPVC
jgi:hypothetical protein